MYLLPIGLSTLVSVVMVAAPIIGVATFKLWKQTGNIRDIFSAGILFIKNIPKKRGWWKQIPQDALQWMKTRIRKRKKEETTES